MAKTSKEKQLDFGFNNPLLNVLAKYKQNMLLRFAYFETKKFVRSPLSWLAITSIFALVAYQGYLLYEVRGLLPSQLPIFSHLIDLRRKLASSDLVLLFPIVTLIQGLFSISISYRSFYKSKELSFLVIYTSVIASILLTIAQLRLIAGYYG